MKKLLGVLLVMSGLCACSGGGASSATAITPGQADSNALSNADLVLTVAPSGVPATTQTTTATAAPSPAPAATAAPTPKTARLNTPTPTTTP